jgi:hypothetical protein
MTHDGQHVVLSNSEGHLDDDNSASHLQENSVMPDTSDLSSLAAAAETHEGMVRKNINLNTLTFY